MSPAGVFYYMAYWTDFRNGSIAELYTWRAEEKGFLLEGYHLSDSPKLPMLVPHL